MSPQYRKYLSSGKNFSQVLLHTIKLVEIYFIQDIDKIVFFCHYFIMAKKKVTKKATAKRSTTTVRRSSSSVSSSQNFFTKHKNLKWLLPLLALLFVVLVVVHHFIDEPLGSTKESSIRENIKNMIDNDKEDNKNVVMPVKPTSTYNSTITPYVTVAPTKGY